MHIDARQLENGSVIEGDICIVGAGAAGISMALQFSGSSRKVILLEGGGFDYEERMQDLYAGTSSGQRYFPLRSIRLHYFGGTTGHWAGFCAPFDDIDFSEREWVPHSGWPIGKADLDPYYVKAHEILELGPYDYREEYWKPRMKGWNPLPFDRKVVWNKLWQFSPPTRFGKKYRDPIVQSKNVHLYTYAQVTNIHSDRSGKHIDSLTIKNHTGKEQTVRAKKFILACCAIQNARLLLASDDSSPKGIGNENDLVGRYFMEHIEMKSAELFLGKPDDLYMYMWNFGTKVRSELAISPDHQKKLAILNGTSSLSPLESAKKQKAFIDNWEDASGNGMAKEMRELDVPSAGDTKTEVDKALQKGYASFQLFTRIEQAPNPESRITLGSEKDELGLRRAHLHWQFTDLEKRSIRAIHSLIGKEAGRSGVARVRLLEYLHDPQDDSWPSFTGGGWHHMGTTRMHSDPKKGVVDAHCKVHGVDNLYIAGSSCFTTAGAPNPTLTLVALSLRLAEHIRQQ
jgi:choline dehydrogenase-like flavoprotein